MKTKKLGKRQQHYLNLIIRNDERRARWFNPKVLDTLKDAGLVRVEMGPTDWIVVPVEPQATEALARARQGGA